MIIENIISKFIRNHVVNLNGSYLTIEKIIEMAQLLELEGSFAANRVINDFKRNRYFIEDIAESVLNKKYRKKQSWIEEIPDETCKLCGKICRVKYKTCYLDCALKIGDKTWGYLGEYVECC